MVVTIETSAAAGRIMAVTLHPRSISTNNQGASGRRSGGGRILQSSEDTLNLFDLLNLLDLLRARARARSTGEVACVEREEQSKGVEDIFCQRRKS